jgi:hypothetical protein
MPLTARRSPARARGSPPLHQHGAERLALARLLRTATPRAEHDYAARVLAAVCDHGSLDADDDALLDTVLQPLASVLRAAADAR